uniref:Protein phosphatase 1L n=1 Tax=Magallana gigas TaxID=29159 RepID=K1QR40_MAGGI
MTTATFLNRFLRKYVFTVESLLFIGLLIFLYHSSSIWQYILSKGKQTDPDIGINENPVHHEHIFPPEQLGRVARELQKDLAAAYALQGRRPHMEDRFNIVSDLEQTGISLFGIFDGHGGEFAAEFTEKTLFKYLLIRIISAELDEQTENFTQMIMEEVNRVDTQLIKAAKANSDISVGGFISFNGVWRVAGVLATSRALGDFPLKDTKMVIADPDILTFNLKFLQPYFMILASDGLWDVFSNQEAVDFIKDRLHEPLFGAKSLVLQAYYRGSSDNISVMVVNFSRGGISKFTSKHS